MTLQTKGPCFDLLEQAAEVLSRMEAVGREPRLHVMAQLGERRRDGQRAVLGGIQQQVEAPLP